MKQNTSWGNVAEWYKKHLTDPNSYHSRVIIPNLLRIMDITKKDTVLDLACGTGFFSEIFHTQGAEVIGVDIAEELITIARQHASPDISFFVAPAHKLDFLNTSKNNNQNIHAINKIALVLAIQNIREVKEMFAECARVLKDKGRLFIVMNHPAFRISGASSWQWDGEHNTQYRRIDEYLSEKTTEIMMHPGKNTSEKTISFHRPLQYYVKLASKAGFAITRLEEWISHKTSESGPRQKQEDRMRKEIPLFMMLELLKM